MIIEIFPLLFWGSITLIPISGITLIYDYIKNKHLPSTLGTVEADDTEELSPFQRGEKNPNLPAELEPENETPPETTTAIAIQTPQLQTEPTQTQPTQQQQPIILEPPKKPDKATFNWDEYELAKEGEAGALKIKTLPNITFSKDAIEVAKLVEQELWVKKKNNQTEGNEDGF
jgi:hypothetical protein